MRPNHTLKQVVFLAVAIIGLAVYAQAIKPAGKGLPPAIAAAFDRDYPHARVITWSEKTDRGAVTCELETMDGITRRDLVYSADGKALEIEERVFPIDLPQPVTLAIARACPGGEVKSAEKVTRGFFLGYEVTVREGKRIRELSLDSNGNVLSSPAPGSGAK